MGDVSVGHWMTAEVTVIARDAKNCSNVEQDPRTQSYDGTRRFGSPDRTF